MQRIKDTVEAIIKELETKNKTPLFMDEPEALLKKTLNPRQLRHIKFNYFKKGILNISVDSPIWLYQLSLEKENLLAKLRQKSTAIKDIRFRLGEIR
ncbi:MAG: DUF721 domain-containing protein [Candidatus Omnitrophica bacterium]|nr:DUF721 domain-containing protein [Candidatus Omnitrophota bacterium]